MKLSYLYDGISYTGITASLHWGYVFYYETVSLYWDRIFMLRQ